MKRTEDLHPELQEQRVFWLGLPAEDLPSLAAGIATHQVAELLGIASRRKPKGCRRATELIPAALATAHALRPTSAVPLALPKAANAP